MRQVFAIFLLGSIGFSGCGDDDDGSSGNNRQRVRLDSDALSQESYSEINSDTAASYIDDQDHFYATIPEDDSSSDSDDGDIFPEEGECPGFKMPRIQASGDRMTLDFAFDIADCGGAVDIGEDRFFFGMYLELHCPGENFSQFNGMTIDESEEAMSDNVCSGSEKMGMKSNVQIHMKSVSDEGIFEIDGRTAETNDGDLCYRYSNGSQMSLGDCQIVDYSKSFWGSSEHYNKPYKENEAGWGQAEDSGPQITVATIVPKGLKFTEGDTYFGSGSFDVSVNGWEGALSFSGGDVKPTYRLSKGEEIIEGTFDEDDYWNIKSAKGMMKQSYQTFREVRKYRPFF